MPLADAMNGFFQAVGGGRQLGLDIAGLYQEGQLGAQKGLAFREAEAEAKRLNDSMVDVNVGTERFDPGSGSALTPAEARAYRQQEGVEAGRRAKTEPRRQADIAGDVSADALYLTRYLPERVKAMRSAGNDKIADRLEQYAAGEVGQRHARGYANMVKAHAAGNFDAAAKAMEDLQELSSEDTQAKVVPDGKGGYKMRITHPRTGESQEYLLDESRLMGEMGMFAYMDPAKMVERFDTQEKAKAANLATVTKAKEETRRQLALKGLDFKYDVARDNLKYQQDVAKMIQQNNLDISKPSDKQRVFEWLEKSGVPRSELDKYIAGIVEGRGGDGVRQAPNPADVARQYIADQYKAGNDAFTALDEDEQIRRATAYAQKLQAATQPAAKPPTQAAAGPAGGLPPIWRP